MSARRLGRIAGAVVTSIAVVNGLVLGTAGWFVIGFGVMTACTNDYSCTESGCSPCAATGWWINAGGLAQLVIAAVAVTALVVGLRRRWSGRLAAAGSALLALSLLTVVGTTWVAQESYCRPGTAGYADSTCAVDL